MGNLLAAVLILKDEAKTIEKTIASLVEFVDAIVVLDTGSTDGTQDIIRRACPSEKLVLREEMFTTYADTRNRALEIAASMRPTLFTLTMSADETLLGADLLRAFLAGVEMGPHGAYCVMLRAGERQWPFPRILRSGAGWKYVNKAGGRHETPVGPAGEIEGPLVPGVFVLHEESDPARKIARLRDSDLPALTAMVDNPFVPLTERVETLFQLAETHFVVGAACPREEDGKQLLGGIWLTHLFAAMGYYNRYAELADQFDPQRAMFARTMYCAVAESFGLFEPVELVKRLRLIVKLSPMMIPEAHFLLARSASKIDPRKAIPFAVAAAKVARAVYEQPVHGATDITIEWKGYLLAADCANSIKETRLQKAYVQKAIAAGAPPEWVGSLADV